MERPASSLRSCAEATRTHTPEDTPKQFLQTRSRPCSEELPETVCRPRTVPEPEGHAETVLPGPPRLKVRWEQANAIGDTALHVVSAREPIAVGRLAETCLRKAANIQLTVQFSPHDQLVSER